MSRSFSRELASSTQKLDSMKERSTGSYTVGSQFVSLLLADEGNNFFRSQEYLPWVCWTSESVLFSQKATWNSFGVLYGGTRNKQQWTDELALDKMSMLCKTFEDLALLITRSKPKQNIQDVICQKCKKLGNYASQCKMQAEAVKSCSFCGRYDCQEGYKVISQCHRWSESEESASQSSSSCQARGIIRASTWVLDSDWIPNVISDSSAKKLRLQSFPTKGRSVPADGSTGDSALMLQEIPISFGNIAARLDFMVILSLLYDPTIGSRFSWNVCLRWFLPSNCQSEKIWEDGGLESSVWTRNVRGRRRRVDYWHKKWYRKRVRKRWVQCIRTHLQWYGRLTRRWERWWSSWG